MDIRYRHCPSGAPSMGDFLAGRESGRTSIF
jgi:hypothetical protein